MLIIILVSNFDLRVAREVITNTEWLAIILAAISCIGVTWGLLVSLSRVYKDGTLHEVNRQPIRISTMVFGIVI